MHFNKGHYDKAFRLALLRIKPQADEEEAANSLIKLQYNVLNVDWLRE